jgi:hypothetical protein
MVSQYDQMAGGGFLFVSKALRSALILNGIEALGNLAVSVRALTSIEIPSLVKVSRVSARCRPIVWA